MPQPRRGGTECTALFIGAAWGLAAASASAEEVSHGEMASAIRGDDHPCAHVVNVENTGDSSWLVQCNSGTFSVSRDGDGNFSVTPMITKADK